MIVVALHNLRLGRGDRRGAFRVAFVALACYLLIEASVCDLEESLLLQVLGLFGYMSGAHALQHAVQVGMIYLAFEPIARRVWPRAIIGWVRLINGRLRDRRVGLEILTGLAIACASGWGVLAAILLDDGSRTIGLAGLTASEAAGIHVVDVGESETKDERIWRIKWYSGLALFSEKGLACATGITN